MHKFIVKLEEKIEDFCSDHGQHEPDTGAFIFDNSEAEAYCEGLEDVLRLAESMDQS